MIIFKQGGIKAVIWTDVLQCILMFLGVAIVIIQGLIELGGFSEAIRILDEGGRLKLLKFVLTEQFINKFFFF